MISKEILGTIQNKFNSLKPEFDERSRRIWAAAEAKALGHGGIVAVSKATGIAESTIRIGRHEIETFLNGKMDEKDCRIRKNGGGRKSLTEKDSRLISLLDALVEPLSRGDTMSPLRWTCKSTRKLAQELSRNGHPVSHAKVGELLEELNYSLQSTRKRMAGKSHPDRDAQFKFINSNVIAFQGLGQPVISVDARKKELIGCFGNGGREYQSKGKPEEGETYDFPSIAEGKDTPYGVYDMTKNEGWVCVGTDHNTAQFAVQTIRQWWNQMGKEAYPGAKELLIIADGGGSNGSRNWLWKSELQGFARENNLIVSVCHFPPGTSKWNKIEHRMFSFITKNWRGRPLVSHEVVVKLIGNTTADGDLKIQAALDIRKYPVEIKVSDKKIEKIKLEKNTFHGEWNYKIRPK